MFGKKKKTLIHAWGKCEVLILKPLCCTKKKTPKCGRHFLTTRRVCENIKERGRRSRGKGKMERGGREQASAHVRDQRLREDQRCSSVGF